MGGKAAYSKLGSILATRSMTVASLAKRLADKGVRFDRKTVYRMASVQPMQTINAPVLNAVCEELAVGVGDVITFDPPKPMLHKIDEEMQRRLSCLMTKNTEGTLTDVEREELMELGERAEELSLENARIAASAVASEKAKGVSASSAARASKMRIAKRQPPGNAVPKRRLKVKSRNRAVS